MGTVSRVGAVGAIAALFSLTACTAAPPSEGEVTRLSFAHVLAESQPFNTCGAVPFKESVEAAGVGLTIDLFPAAQTHNDTLEQLDALDSGNLDITFAGPAQLATRVPKLAAFEAAYAFRDPEHMLETVQGPDAAPIWDELRDEAGMRVIGFGYYGTRHLTSNIEVATPDDMDGVKLRVVDAPLWIDNGIALGGQPTPVAFAELYLALQQGVVDAEENPLPVISAQGFDEVQEYVNLTGHVTAMLATVIAEPTWERLTDEQREALTIAGEELGASVTECTLSEEEELLEAWMAPDSPITVNDDVDLDAFRDRAADVLLAKYDDEWGDLYRAFSE